MTSYDDYSIAAYGRMITDQRRTAPFMGALERAITPGCTVLDIGTGTGIFAFMACRFGAERVYAVEADANALATAKACAAAIEGNDRITWIHGITTALDLPERVDVVVGDLHGTLPFFKGNIESLVDARKRHMKPGGRMLPARDLLYAAPAYAPREYQHIENPWLHNDYGIDLSAALPRLVNNWGRARAEPVQADDLLAQPACWGVLDYSSAESADLDGSMEWRAGKAQTMHGFFAWFDGDLGDGFGYSNAPTLPELVYGRAFFPLEQPVDVAEGDDIHVRLAARMVKGRHVFRWTTRVMSPDGSRKAGFEQSTFKAQPLSLEELRKLDANYVPQLRPEGEAVRFILDAMAEGRRLQDIASAAAARFPERYRTHAQALDEVAGLSSRYG